MKLTESESTAIDEAHNTGVIVDGNVQFQDLLKKARILDRAGFNKAERRALIESGRVGYQFRKRKTELMDHQKQPFLIDEFQFFEESDDVKQIQSIIEQVLVDPVKALNKAIATGKPLITTRTGTTVGIQKSPKYYRDSYDLYSVQETGDIPFIINPKNPEGEYILSIRSPKSKGTTLISLSEINRWKQFHGEDASSFGKTEVNNPLRAIAIALLGSSELVASHDLNRFTVGVGASTVSDRDGPTDLRVIWQTQKLPNKGPDGRPLYYFNAKHSSYRPIVDIPVICK